MPQSNQQVGFNPEAFEILAKLETGYWWFEARNRLILDAIEKHFSPLTQFLEMGCGTGFVLQAIQKTYPNAEITGTELLEEGLAVSRKRLPTVKLEQLDARKLSKDENLQFVGAFDVLEHIPEDTLVLENLFHSIRKGGGIILTVPQHPSLWSQADEIAHHVRRYTKKDLVQKVKAAGFTIEQVHSFVSFLVPLMWLSRKRKSSAMEKNPLREFQLPGLLNKTLGGIMKVERLLTKMGLNFPIGGSLLLVAKKT